MSLFDRFRPYPELRVAIVNLKSGTAFKGVVWKRGGGVMILKNAELLSDLGRQIEKQAIDGELLVLLTDVDFVQVL